MGRHQSAGASDGWGSQEEPPEHDLNMPHDFKEGIGNIKCPPNCPHRLWHDIHDPAPDRFRGSAVPAMTTASPQDAATDFMKACGLEPTLDAVYQLTDAFLPCLRIMCDPEHPWDPNGATWRKGGIMSVLTDAKKKWERFWERTWTHGKRHDDSGFDLINFVGFVMRSDPNSRWGSWGEPK